MNIYGLKLHKKIVAEKLKKELAKPRKHQSPKRIRNLEKTRRNYSRRIRELKQERDNKK